MKKIIQILVIIGILFFISQTIYGIYQESNIKEGKQQSSVIKQNQTTMVKQQNNADSYFKESLVDLQKEEYEGYEVEAKMMIPKINLETYILKEKSKEAMALCPVKWYGPEANENGNFCIAGHNYNKTYKFNKLKELEIGDKISLINYLGNIEYEIYDIYKVTPQEIYPLSQETNYQKELTIITCTDYSNKRIIIKAKAV